MKLACAISGIHFQCDHFTVFQKSIHPIFTLSQDKLLALYRGKWTTGNLSETESYLLYLSLLNSTKQIRWFHHAIQHARTNQVVAGNMPRIAELINRISDIPESCHTIFAAIAITNETADLNNSNIWIDIWQDNLRDYHNGYRTYTASRKIANREEALQKLIKDSSKDLSRYARLLAKWASEAGNFPVFSVKSPISDREITCSEYWQEIIVCLAKREKAYLVPKADIEELVDHVTENIQPGTIYQHTLSTLLKDGHKIIKDYFGFGELDVSTSFTILPTDASVEAANIQAMIDSAPSELPIEKNYPSRLAYLRAKAKWDMKLKNQEPKS